MTETPQQDASPALPERFVALLTDHLDVQVTPEELSPEATFDSLGMDSLSLMELVVAAEEELEIVLPEDALDLSPSTTLGAVARVFEHVA